MSAIHSAYGSSSQREESVPQPKMVSGVTQEVARVGQAALTKEEFAARHCISLKAFTDEIQESLPSKTVISQEEFQKMHNALVNMRYERYLNPIHPYSNPGWILHPDFV
jgi:hypothetical protein